MLMDPNPPKSISTSYQDDEQTIPLSYATRACNGFAQLGASFDLSATYLTFVILHGYSGARGVSLMFASGDGGVGDGDPDPTRQVCFTNDGKYTHRFLPGFPSSCP